MTQIGTLSDIGAQVGDVVQYGDGGCSTITRIDGRYFSKDAEGYSAPLCEDANFRIIRRSNSPASPIRTVTVQEVVPGIWGKVSIHEARPDSGGYYIAMVDNLWHKGNTIHAAMTIDDIDKAISVLTEIREAMK